MEDGRILGEGLLLVVVNEGVEESLLLIVVDESGIGTEVNDDGGDIIFVKGWIDGS